MLHPVTDYTVLQRNAEGYAEAYFAGKCPKLAEDEALFCRVLREDDNAVVVPWEKCVLSDGEWSATLRVTCERKFTLPAKFHAYWTCNPPLTVPRDLFGMPMLAVYGVEITK